MTNHEALTLATARAVRILVCELHRDGTLSTAVAREFLLPVQAGLEAVETVTSVPQQAAE